MTLSLTSECIDIDSTFFFFSSIISPKVVISTSVFIFKLFYACLFSPIIVMDKITRIMSVFYCFILRIYYIHTIVRGNNAIIQYNSLTCSPYQ